MVVKARVSVAGITHAPQRVLGNQPDTLVEALPGPEAPLLHILQSLLATADARHSERALAARLGVTRHRLRQALMELRTQGKIAPTAPRRAGASARDREALIRATNPIEVIELRLALEPTLARLAAMRATPLEIARIERAATTSANADSGAADLAFHRLVASASGNALATELYAMLRQVGTDVRMRMAADRPTCPKWLSKRDAEHRAIAGAIATRDPDGAERAMRLHLDAVQQRITERLAPRLGAA
jgi:DNA-binding FadR family transcriptional regulator